MSGQSEVPTPSLNVLQRPPDRGQPYLGGGGCHCKKRPMLTLGWPLQFSITLVLSLPRPRLP